jgi:hypothetical protein
MYTVWFTAKAADDDTTVLDTVLKTIPNDNLRLSNITAGIITDASSSTAIGFNVNADCSVKAVVCKPGTKFQLATSAGSLVV